MVPRNTEFVRVCQGPKQPQSFDSSSFGIVAVLKCLVISLFFSSISTRGGGLFVCLFVCFWFFVLFCLITFNVYHWFDFLKHCPFLQNKSPQLVYYASAFLSCQFFFFWWLTLSFLFLKASSTLYLIIMFGHVPCGYQGTNFVCSFLQGLKEFQGPNSGHQVIQQVPSLDMPSCWSPVPGTF